MHSDTWVYQQRIQQQFIYESCSNINLLLYDDPLLLVLNIVLSQASAPGSPSPATATVAKYLLKLWIQQRLEQVSVIVCHVS